MKSIWQHLLFAGALMLSLLAPGAEKSFPVLPLKQAPETADWNSPVWKDVPAASGFRGLKRKEFAPRRQTLFKMGWHNNVLYVLTKCFEPDVENIKTDKANYRDGWYPDDHVEFLICTNRNAAKKIYKQFVANSIGGRWCNITFTGNTHAWAAAAKKEKGAWTVLMRIPFSVIGASASGKDSFFFNLARIANTKDSDRDEVHLCFAPVVGGFSHLPSFIPLTFVSPASSAAAAETIRKEFNPLEKLNRAKLWKIAYVKEAFLADRASDPTLKPLLDLKQKAKEVLRSKDNEKAIALISDYEKYVSSLAKPMKKSTVEVKTKNASVKLFLNGKEISLNSAGKAEIAIDEGFSVLAAECTATGANPGVKVNVLACPETDGRWKAASGTDDKKIFAADFDDSAWKAPVSRNGFLWSADGGKTACMRQVLLFNSRHDGPNRCINPLVKEWGFSIDSVEPFFLMLNPPLKGLSADYEFVLDLPEGFRLLDLKHNCATGWWGSKVKINCVPKSVTASPIVRGGVKFTRNVIRFNAEDICGTNTYPCILPVKLDSSRKPGEKLAFRYFRRIAGNFTEIEQKLPVKVLPKINGRMNKDFILSLYCAIPYFGAKVSDEALKAFVNTASDAGINTWTCGGFLKKSMEKNPYIKLLVDTLRERKATITRHWYNFPAWRGSVLHPSRLRDFVDSVPEAKARYFHDMPAWVSLKTDISKLKKEWNRVAMYCPTYMTTTGREKFVELVSGDLLRLLPKLDDGIDSFFWINWESEPWQAGNTYTAARTGMGSYCFCDKCKAAFAKSVGLPEGTKLTDDEIFSKYYQQWAQFRYKLDGEIQSLINEAVHKTGRKYIVYSWISQEPFWVACKGRTDYAFPGCPGNAPADAANQPMMDRSVAFLREKAGFKKIIGQRFSFFGTYYSQGSQGWKSYGVMSNSGYIEAKTWKSQILRVAATMQGGVDLQSSLECVAGMMYYIGEATRAISDFADIFANGKRNDSLASSKEIRYPNLLVLAKGDERLVLLFNEGGKPVTAELENKSLKPGQTAKIWGSTEKVPDASRMKVTIPENDVVLVHIK